MSDVVLRATGSIGNLSPQTRIALFDRGGDSAIVVRARTTAIIDRVRTGGDLALQDMAREFDDVHLTAIEVPRSQWTSALSELSVELRRAMERAAENIRQVHTAFKPSPIEISPEPGIVVGRRPDPLGRVGIYAPGGRAVYPSSLLMGAIPARVAGVGDVIVCSPPGKNGLPHAVVLAAAEMANVDRVFAIGGAGAIAAMAFGTESVPRVDRIVGPGNAYVAEAKLQVVSHVAIDAPAGPSELLVIGDSSAKPDVIAREMIAQAEHDPDAAVVAILVSDEGADSTDRQATSVLAALGQQLALAPRAAIAREALSSRGAVLASSSLPDAIAFANEWAAEHLLLLLHPGDETATLASLRNVGTVFVGSGSSVSFGDYMTGANHVLPTAGAARSYSGLSTLDFVRWTTWQRVSPQAAARLAGDVGIFADAEGLPGHASAARAWLNAGVDALDNDTGR